MVDNVTPFHMPNTPRSIPLAQRQVLFAHLNRVIHGNCINIMQCLPNASVDFAITDPPYLVRYRSRDNRCVENDNPADTNWLFAAMSELYRILKPNSLAVSMYGWPQIEIFMSAWRKAGFYPVAHLSFHKRYKLKKRYAAYQHEVGFVLAKGNPVQPPQPPCDILPFYYSGNRHHPTEKHPKTWLPLLRAYTKPNDIIIDPFAGSASTAFAATALGRRFIAIELDKNYADIASRRMNRVMQHVAQHREGKTHTLFHSGSR